MRMLTLAAAALVAAAARADEPKLPADLQPPMPAYARAATEGKAVFVTLKLVDAVPATENRTVTEYTAQQRVENGKNVTVMVPVTKTVPVTVMKATGWREVKVDLATPDVSVRDAAGKPVAADKLPGLLGKEAPVLVSATGPVDPFHLLTAKADTLVVVAPPHVLFPPARPAPDPKGAPAPLPAPVVSPKK